MFNVLAKQVRVGLKLLFRSQGNKLLAKENIPPVITLQYMYLCSNYIQTNLIVTSN